MSRFDRYMAIPYRDHGRSFDGADCFGVCLLILAHEAGIGLADPNAVVATVEAEIASGRWQRIAEGDGAAVKRQAQLFDLVVMSGHMRRGMAVVNADLHIGICIGVGRLIHSESESGCSCVAFDDPAIVRRVKAVYRPQALVRSAA